MASRKRRPGSDATRSRRRRPATTKRRAPKRGASPGFPKGSKHPSAQLTLAQVKALRAGKHDHQPYARLAAKWGVSPAAISLARTGRTWSWVPGARKPIKPTDPKRHRKRATGRAR
ncbi:MAG: hypothetical protein IT361_10155 [Gemmatimonadaceae bacterium]|nr:hypothetical protein [Gemmatimonadaceae bacterium]